MRLLLCTTTTTTTYYYYYYGIFGEYNNVGYLVVFELACSDCSPLEE